MKKIPEDEYAVLVEKAAAWDSYIRRRLAGSNEIVADLEIHCSKGDAIVTLLNHVGVTPFGAIPLDHNIPVREFHIVRGDSIKISHKVNLTLDP